MQGGGGGTGTRSAGGTKTGSLPAGFGFVFSSPRKKRNGGQVNSKRERHEHERNHLLCTRKLIGQQTAKKLFGAVRCGSRGNESRQAAEWLLLVRIPGGTETANKRKKKS